MIPAMKRPPMETDISPPHTTIMMLGGMITPITEEHAVMATEKLESYPCFFIAGIISEPIPAASAVDEPEIPANSMLTTTLTCPSPPGKWPTDVRARFTSRSVMPAAFIRLAANRKNGTASRMNELYDFHISLISRMGVSRSSRNIMGTQASASANDTGIRRTISTPNVPNMITAASLGLIVSTHVSESRDRPEIRFTSTTIRSSRNTAQVTPARGNAT